MTMRPRIERLAAGPHATRVAWYVFATTWVAVALCRVWLVSTGPDLDTDAYGHAAAGRAFVVTPGDLSVHWVWLPLWHLIHAAAAVARAGMTGVRVFNVAVSLASPPALAALIVFGRRQRDRDLPLPRGAPKRTSRAERAAGLGLVRLLARVRRCADALTLGAERGDAGAALAPLAGTVLALWPMMFSLGQGGQPEALFQLLLLLALLGLTRDRTAAAGAALALACLLRYEAWAVVPVFAWLWWRRLPRGTRGAAAWVLPSLAIAAWCALQAVVTHKPLDFLRQNHAFAQDALRVLGTEIAHAGPVRKVAWYVYLVPERELRWGFLATLAGTPWFVRRAPLALRLSAAALLAFLTLGLFGEHHLGLARHFAAIAPAYAASTAAGAVTLGSWVAARVTRSRPLRPGVLSLIARAPSLGRPALLACALVLAYGSARAAPAALSVARGQASTALAERHVASSLAASAASGDRVYCDQSIVEVLSGLPPEAFDRRSARDVRADDYRADLAAAHASFVVTRGHDPPPEGTRFEPIACDGELCLLRARPR